MQIWPDVRCEYDDGYFDKDEQGWCSRWTRVSQEGPEVTVRRWGDDNGIRGYDEAVQGTIAAVNPELGLVKFTGRLSGYCFDLRARRLRTTTEQWSIRFTPAPDYLEPAGVRRAIALVAEAVVTLGGRPAPVPEPPPWPPLTQSPTCEGADEVQVEVDAGDGRVFRLTRREFRDGSLGPQLAVDLVDPAAQAWLFIVRPGEGSLVLVGNIELRPTAEAAVAARVAAGV
jgi:hypothetical protein